MIPSIRAWERAIFETKGKISKEQLETYLYTPQGEEIDSNFNIEDKPSKVDSKNSLPSIPIKTLKKNDPRVVLKKPISKLPTIQTKTKNITNHKRKNI
jgi:hypothetical protein